MNGDNGRLQPLLTLLTEGGVPEDVQQRLVRREEDFRRQLRGAGEGAARRHLVVRALRGIVEGVRTMRPASKVVAAAAMVLLVVVALSWPTPSGRGSGLAFADVVEQLNTVHTARFRMTMRVDGQPETVARAFLLEPSRMRIEFLSGLVKGLVTIKDSVGGKTISFSPETKWASISQDDGVPEAKNYFEVLRSFRDRATELLGERELEGRIATGYRVEDGGGLVTVWADRETGLPMLIHCTAMPHGGEVVLSDFEYNVRLDESLFDFTPPPDYTVVEKSKGEWSAEMCKGHLAHIASAFIYYLTDNGNKYPERLNDLLPYVEGPEVLCCPVTGKEYVYVKPMKPLALFTGEPAGGIMVVFDEAGNHLGGRRALFDNLLTRWVTEEEFQRLWAEQERHAAPKGPASAGEGQEGGSEEGR
jgi:outer membrane lipoprotein-sorting protein